jgi:hypothetical protein
MKSFEETIFTMPVTTAIVVQKSNMFFCLKTALLTRNRTFCLADGLERVLGH